MLLRLLEASLQPKNLFCFKKIKINWLNRNKYSLGKLNLTKLWVLVTIYQKNTWLFVLVTIYSKIKRKTKHRSTYPKELSSGARLRNGKVFGTHSTQTESGLLDSNDQDTLFAWCEWYFAYMTHLTKIDSHKSILWMYPLFRKIQICFCE